MERQLSNLLTEGQVFVQRFKMDVAMTQTLGYRRNRENSTLTSALQASALRGYTSRLTNYEPCIKTLVRLKRSTMLVPGCCH